MNESISLSFVSSSSQISPKHSQGLKNTETSTSDNNSNNIQPNSYLRERKRKNQKLPKDKIDPTATNINGAIDNNNQPSQNHPITTLESTIPTNDSTSTSHLSLLIPKIEPTLDQPTPNSIPREPIFIDLIDSCGFDFDFSPIGKIFILAHSIISFDNAIFVSILHQMQKERKRILFVHNHAFPDVVFAHERNPLQNNNPKRNKVIVRF